MASESLVDLTLNSPRTATKSTTDRNPHAGSSFANFMEEEGLREEAEAVALKRVIAWQLQQAMKAQGKTKQAMAGEIHTSRSQLDRLLDPENASVSLLTIARAANALGKRMVVSLEDRTGKSVRQSNEKKVRRRSAARIPA
jgi:hypothetical protein